MVENKYQIKLKKFGLVNWIGFTTLYLKEISRFLVVWAQTILSPLVSSLLFLTVLTLAIGNERGALFLLPNLLSTVRKLDAPILFNLSKVIQ